jgi:hypothetical protein
MPFGWFRSSARAWPSPPPDFGYKYSTMPETIFAAFPDARHAEQAAGALLDRGAKPEDVSIVVGNIDESAGATTTLSTTTPADAVVGAAKGAGIGAGVGVLAALTSIFIPGIGFVAGAGALAAAISAAAGSAVGGAIAGGVTGLLIDQGVHAEDAHAYQEVITGGGAILSLSLPSGELLRSDADDVLAKYGANETNVVMRSSRGTSSKSIGSSTN